jgi:hypothetical protein
MAGLLHLKKRNAQLSFTPPTKFLDPLEGPIERLTECFCSVHDYCDSTSIPTSTARCDKHTVTSLAPVNTIVAHCHIISLASALQTQIQDKPLEAEQSTDTSSAPRPDTSKFFLAVPAWNPLVWNLLTCLRLAMTVSLILYMALLLT